MTNNTILSCFSSFLQNLNPTIQNSLTAAQHPGAIYTSRPIGSLISTVISSRKRNIEELIDTHDNNGDVIR